MPSLAFSEQALAAARSRLSYAGISIRAFARDHGLGQSIVYEVLSGRRKCSHGASHKAAVLLGLKEGSLDQSSL